MHARMALARHALTIHSAGPQRHHPAATTATNLTILTKLPPWSHLRRAGLRKISRFDSYSSKSDANKKAKSNPQRQTRWHAAGFDRGRLAPWQAGRPRRGQGGLWPQLPFAQRSGHAVHAA